MTDLAVAADMLLQNPQVVHFTRLSPSYWVATAMGWWSRMCLLSGGLLFCWNMQRYLDRDWTVDGVISTVDVGNWDLW